MMVGKTNYEVNKDKKAINIIREFKAPVEEVWKAWTTSDALEQWWAPKPWKAQTEKMDFREGGCWLYCMVGPEGEKSWVGFDYKNIDPNKRFTARDYFCDENGNRHAEFPNMNWTTNFIPTATGTRVEVRVEFDSEADLEKIIELGFAEGTAMAYDNLDELIASAPDLKNT
ncbi:MAG: Activator of Hsp90 ATPase 1 family protein [Bacteroidetes bacterium]|jgi:uncharacterized protein YndB with AHSA1/START domain|nr:Activator of Hsp90 ATPase 1 family protein [Bacteroidota bacterium]